MPVDISIVTYNQRSPLKGIKVPSKGDRVSVGSNKTNLNE